MTKLVVELETEMPAHSDVLAMLVTTLKDALQDSEVTEMSVTGSRFGTIEKPSVVVLYGDSMLNLQVAGPFWSAEEAAEHVIDGVAYWQAVDLKKEIAL